MKDTREYISVDENEWTERIATTCFQYNTSVNTVIDITPCKAVFGVDAFDHDAKLGRRMALNEETQTEAELIERQMATHWNLLIREAYLWYTAEKHYKKLVEDTQYEIEDRMIVFNPCHHLEKGRKLKTPRIRQYRIEEELIIISYKIRSEIGRKTAPLRVNRLIKIGEEV